MLLSSSTYFIFLVAIFALYWPLARVRAIALGVILLANYFFYAKWDLYYLALIPVVSSWDFAIGLGLQDSATESCTGIHEYHPVVGDVICKIRAPRDRIGARATGGRYTIGLRIRIALVLEVTQSDERHQLPARTGHIQILELLGREALGALHLGNDLVAATLNREAIDVISAQQRAQVGAHLLFLPAYSPDLNPIEQLFAKLKHFLRKDQPRTVEATWRKVADILDLFSPIECANYLKNSGFASI